MLPVRLYYYSTVPRPAVPSQLVDPRGSERRSGSGPAPQPHRKRERGGKRGPWAGHGPRDRRQRQAGVRASKPMAGGQPSERENPCRPGPTETEPPHPRTAHWVGWVLLPFSPREKSAQSPPVPFHPSVRPFPTRHTPGIRGAGRPRHVYGLGAPARPRRGGSVGAVVADSAPRGRTRKPSPAVTSHQREKSSWIELDGWMDR